MLFRNILPAVASLVLSVNAQSPTTEREIPTLSPQINAAPSLTPTIYDDSAPDPQACPGYTASNVAESSSGFTADLTIAGDNCQAFGNDISALVLEVHYQTKERLNVKIYPRDISPANSSWYILPSYLVPVPESDDDMTADNSDLALEWSNDPTFQFKVSRSSTGEELFSTYGHVLVYEDQFLELVTNMVSDYNVYGLAENIRDFRHGDNYTQTFYAVDAGNPVDGNAYSVHPFYQETRYGDSGTTSHGVYARNAHGQEWLLRSDTITYRTLGGSFDLYFLSGQSSEDDTSSAVETIRQYQQGCSGLPAMQPFWAFGFHQCRWGYENISVSQSIVDGYRDANIPLETFQHDIDIYQLYRDFTINDVTYPVPEFTNFIRSLHANHQRYVPIVDSNIYRPNPENASDSYATYEDGAEQGTFIRNPRSGDFYTGNNWPGFSVWADFLLSSSQEWWTNALATWYEDVPFDGIWIDLSEASSFCVGSCGELKLDQNPVHPPFLLPGDPLTFDFRYPEGFNVSNATDAASASAASSSQVAALSSTTLIPVPTTTTRGRTEPTPGSRNLTYPPYVINHIQAGHALVKGAISPDATHSDPYNTTEYEMHNLYGLQISNATYYALLEIFPGRRPFTIGRSTFTSSGKTTSHWGGDNTSTWGSMFLSISQALTFMMSGVPMFGADTCGFAGNTDFDLCSRWMELSAFFPFYRNHNVKATIGQEAFRWSSVAEASRRAMSVRYSLLNYMYTLFHYAHMKGDTVMRALAWEFPEDESLKATYAQFLLGPSLLITPVLIPNSDTVNGVFPGKSSFPQHFDPEHPLTFDSTCAGIGEGTRWYDWYTLEEVSAQPGENITLSAPLEHINVHARGGAIFTLQTPRYTTAETKNSSYSLLVTLDDNESASGTVYLDDGVSLEPEDTKLITFTYKNGCLRSSISGTYAEVGALANITIAGLKEEPQGYWMGYGGRECPKDQLSMEYSGGVMKITGMEGTTSNGAFEHELEMYVK